MKKLLVSILLLAYLGLSSGVMVNFHYCMKQLASVELFAAQKDTCGQCGMEYKDKSDSSCCHDDVLLLKAKDDHQLSILKDFQIQPVIVALPEYFYLKAIPLSISGQNYRSDVRPPPLLNKNPLYIQHNVFLI